MKKLIHPADYYPDQYVALELAITILRVHAGRSLMAE
jgi:hypothetical protein